MQEAQHGCIVKKNEDGWGVYEKEDNFWVATFRSEEAAKDFADEYQDLKSRYLARESEKDKKQVQQNAEAEDKKRDDVELDRDIEEALKKIYN